ncbi:MAG: 4-hydroxy-tetrahydrodipicolinate synthase [Bacillota bacterium]
MTIFNGSGTALITPFINDKVDFPALKKLVRFQLDNGTSALIINGTTGEPTTMTHFERTAVATTVIKEVNGAIPVILGAGSNNTYTAVEYAEEAEELGADGILAVTPYYNKCTQEGIYQHYKAMSDAVNIPIIMYNVPGRTGVNIAPKTALRCAELKNIVAIKEASGNIAQFMELARLVKGKLDIYSGDDGLVYTLMSLGGKGVISVASNIIPQHMADMVAAYESGDAQKSLDMQFEIAGLVEALFSEVNPIPVKCAAKLMGLCSDYMRLPLTKMQNEAYMESELKKLGIIK